MPTGASVTAAAMVRRERMSPSSDGRAGVPFLALRRRGDEASAMGRLDLVRGGADRQRFGSTRRGHSPGVRCTRTRGLRDRWRPRRVASARRDRRPAPFGLRAHRTPPRQIGARGARARVCGGARVLTRMLRCFHRSTCHTSTLHQHRDASKFGRHVGRLRLMNSEAPCWQTPQSAPRPDARATPAAWG